MEQGKNRSNDFVALLRHVQETFENNKRDCIFISHTSQDKPACKIIAKYISNAGFDYYLDELDDSLQAAVSAGNPFKIIECLKEGIRESTHMVVVISEKSIRSPWIPFEIGYGHAAIIDKFQKPAEEDYLKKLAILTLKDISEKDLPDFIRTAYLIRGIKSLNEYLASISGQRAEFMINEKQLAGPSTRSDLDTILNRYL